MLEVNSFPTKHFHLISFTCLSLILNLCKAQSSMEPVPTYITHHSWEPSVAITVGAIIFALLLMGILSIYLRRCAESHIIITTTTTTVPCSCSQGINKELLNTFPTLFYSNIKDLKKGKETLECAVCLTDFTDKDALRLLPKCNHVFHPHCIDSWLASHVTCPVCRANLSQESCHVSIAIPTDEEATPAQIEQNDTSQVCIGDPISTTDMTKIVYINEEQLSHNLNNDVSHVCIGDPILTTSQIPNNDASQACITKTVYISEEQLSQSPNNDISQVCITDSTLTSDMNKIVYINEEQSSSYEVASGVELDSNTSPITDGGDGVVVSERNFLRSNSTGHSLAEQGKGVERYTLRLPEDVRRYILVNHRRSVQRSASVKGVCWSDKEDSNAGKRVEKRWMICTPPFVTRHG